MYSHVSLGKAIEMLDSAYNGVTMKNALLTALDSLNYYHCTHLHSYTSDIPVSDRLPDWSDHYVQNYVLEVPGIKNEITLNNKTAAISLQEVETTGQFGD